MGNDIVNILNKNTGSSNDGINFRQAISNTEEDCFRLSGCERLLDYLKRELGNDTQILIDFSALPSSFDSKNRLADFISIYDPSPSRDSFLPISQMNKAYHQVYDSLGIGGRNLGMFYKKEFFYASETSSYYYSDTPLPFPYPIDNDIIVDNKTQEESWKDLSQYNVYFVNKSYKLSFRQYVDNLMNDNNDYDCQKRNDILLYLYNEYFTLGKKGNLLSVPLIGFPGKKEVDNGSFEGLGAIFIYFISDKKIDDSKIHRIANDIWFIGLQITYNSMFQIAYELSETARLESIKSAIAAIMSRNMSHNLGSHFISNTKNYFSALIDQGGDSVANYRGVKHALQYIQERMDFIATVTSSDIYPFGAVNAKAQFFDELTPDDFGKRHDERSYNFLLDYLVLSEKISKRSWLGDGSVLSAGDYCMHLQIGHWDGEGNPTYWNPESNSDEENVKRDEILRLNFAIPGGILGRHALLSIVENIIRNSAKHGQGKFKDDKFVIRMLYRYDQHRLVIFDNKEDKHIKNTVEGLKSRLKNIHLLKNGQLDHDNKGLKEMLVSAIWLQNENVAQVMTENELEKDENVRLRIFEKYIKVVSVNEEGVEFDPNENSKGYLGYSIKLDKFDRVHYLEENEIHQGLNGIKADIVCYHEDIKIGEKSLSEIFPRFLKISIEDKNNLSETEILKRIVERNCPNAVQKKMVVSHVTDYRDDTGVVSSNNWNSEGDAFLFKGHAAKSKWDKFCTLFLTKGFEDKYVDAISGGDFTSTLVQPSFVADKYNLLKIKESVATRFVIIDERICEHYRPIIYTTTNDLIKIRNDVAEMKKMYTDDELYEKMASYIFSRKGVLGNGVYQDHKEELEGFVKKSNLLDVFFEKDIEQHYLDRKGLFVYNIEPYESGFKMIDLSLKEMDFSWKSDKTSFKETASIFNKSQQLTFLTIHLGLIDKIREQIIRNNDAGDNKESKIVDDLIDQKIVEALKNHFGAKFVSIHSGRGGFDIRDSLKQYAFQNFSSIENPLYNSKFLLSQQFYNGKYYGTEK